MYHRVRQAAVIGMGVAAATLLFTGCSSNDDNNKSSESSTTAAASGETSASASADAGAAATETKIATPNGEFVVSGHILTKYTEMGGPTGTLGAPTGNIVNGPNGGSCQEFTGGAVCWSEQTGPHVVWGDIRKAWDADGGVNGKLGYPTSDEKDAASGKESDFIGGSITWNSTDRQTQVTQK